jgi:hypothetical protein
VPVARLLALITSNRSVYGVCGIELKSILVGAPPGTVTVLIRVMLMMS